jgi:hypothetical protein
MAINLSTNDLANVVRNTNFSETVSVTVDGVPPEVISSITVTPSQSDSGVTISTTTSSIAFSGSYEEAFLQDIIKSFPVGKSSMLKDGVYGDDPSTTDVVETNFEVEAEKELTTAEFELKKQEFPTIVQPTTSTSFAAVPSDHTVFNAVQDNRRTVTITYSVSVVYNAGTHTDTITHVIDTDITTFANKLTELYPPDE